LAQAFRLQWQDLNTNGASGQKRWALVFRGVLKTPMKVAGKDAPDKFLPGLSELERAVQKDVQEVASFRKANQAFDARDDTTQLLLAACEKLWNEKLAMEKARFEEHTSSLHLVCQHLRTTIDQGLTELVWREKLASENAGRPIPNKRSNAGIFAFCCQAEFPEQQPWWHEITRKMVADYVVLRGGTLTHQFAHDLVPGDIVYLSAGQKCAADSRVLLCTESAMVDSSHVTGRLNDVRVLSKKPTASSVTESRNVVLRDSYIVHGSLFSMIVRPGSNAFIPPAQYGGNEQFHPTVNMQAPEGIPSSTCQNVFKMLCVKANLFCKAFKVMQKLAEVNVVLICLTQELVASCNMKKLNAALNRLHKAVLFVNCDCEPPILAQLCSDLNVTKVDFDDTSDGCSSTTTHLSDICEYVGGSITVQRLSESDYARAEGVINTLFHAPATVLLGNVNQAVLLHVCRNVAKPNQPLLFVANGFFFAQCFMNLTREEPQAFRHMNSIAAMGSSRLSPTGTYSRELSSDPDSGRAAMQLSQDEREERRASDRQATSSTMTQSPDAHQAGIRAPRTSRSSRANSNVVHFQVHADHSETGPDGPHIRPEDSVASLPTVATSTGSPVVSRGATSPYHRWRDPPGSSLEFGALASGSISAASSNDGHHHGHMDPVSAHGSTKIGERSILLLSANSLGVLSEEADCILTKPDLSSLVQAFDILQRKLPRRYQHA